MSIRPYRDIVRRKSRKIRVGSVEVGGDAPITVARPSVASGEVTGEVARNTPQIPIAMTPTAIVSQLIVARPATNISTPIPSTDQVNATATR